MTQCVERVKEYRWSFQLVKNAKLSDGLLVVDRDADFEWRGYKWGAKLAVAPTLNFISRLSDSRGRPLSSAFQDTASLCGPLGGGGTEKSSASGGLVVAVWPPRLIPAGLGIRIEIQETSGNNQTMVIMLTAIGVKRYGGV